MPSLNTGNAILSNPIKVDSSYNVGIGGAASGSFKLQVTGTGNFTGALSGTSATFSGALEAGKLGGAVTVGDLFVDSANNSVYVGRQSSTSGDNSKFYVRNRLNTLTALSVDPGGNGAVDVVGTFSSTRGTNLATATGNVGVGVVNPTGTYGKLSVAGGISILDDNNAKLEIGRYSSGAPNSYIKIGTNSGSLRITNAADTIDLVSFLNSGFTFFGNIPSATNYIKYNFNVGTDQNIGFRSSASIARLEATNDAVNANVPMEFAASTFIFTGGNVGIDNSSPNGKFEVGSAGFANSSVNGGHLFNEIRIAQGTWTTFANVTNNTWNGITELTWTSLADYNRSGAAYMRWAYEAGAAALGVVYTLFNNSQNATATFRNSGGALQIFISGGAADYYVQVRVQGSRAA